MMNTKNLSVIVFSCMCMSVMHAKDKLPYQNPKLAVEVRVNDLLQRMTLEEKVGQLQCTLGWDYYQINGNKVEVSEKFKKDLATKQMGMLWATYRADPWTKKTLTNGLTPELAAKAGNVLQKYVIENTRLGIPLFLAEEAPHGHMAIGATVFPTGLGMAATWSVALAEEMGQVVAREVRLQGGHISYGPVLDLSRDPRWSRVEESFGEDPVLSGCIGAAQVRGLGAGNLSHPDATIATLKHFIAYGITESGQNGGPAVLGQRELYGQILPPFRQTIDAGALSVMTSYNSLDGIPSTVNAELLTDVLRKQWQFKGFVVSDLYSVDGVFHTHHVVPSLQDAAIASLGAGVDVDLGANGFALLTDAVQSGKISSTALDEAVARVLRLKMQMGLFEHPYADAKAAAKGVRTAAHTDVARRAAQASVTLLKNDGHILPLQKNIKVAVVGPNAHSTYNLLGDYTAPQEEGNVKTILDGIRTKLPSTHIEYVKGCAIRDTTTQQIEQAVAAAHRADVVIVAVGGSSARDFKTSYQETGAAISDSKTISDMESGEGFDRATLDLLGLQPQLLQALKATGKPLVVVYVEGRPLDKVWAATHADALLTAYYPGQEGGTAIADVLFGDYNPAGRLPVTVPRHVGQIPIYYNKRNPPMHDYVELSAKPLYAFGYGLSYSTFEYANMNVSGDAKNGYTVAFDVTNTSSRDGEEVAQLYLKDDVASVVQPMMQLKRFERTMIKAGETKRFAFKLTRNDLSLINQQMQHVVDPGTFTVMVGPSSDRIVLKATLQVE